MTIKRKHRLFPVAAAGAIFLAGASLGLGVGRQPGDLGMLVAATGVLLVAGFRAYEGRLQEQERYVESLERRRDATQHERDNLEALYLDTLETFAATEDAHLPAAHRRHRLIQDYAMQIALEMGLDTDDSAALRTAALVHDVGRSYVSPEVWTRPGPLTEAEWRQVRNHVDHATHILAHITFPWPVTPIIHAHHEHWDGLGYPLGLTGDDIPLGARILAVADAFEALTADRPHRLAHSRESAVGIIVAESGTRFDPDVVRAFHRVLSVDLDRIDPPAPRPREPELAAA